MLEETAIKDLTRPKAVKDVLSTNTGQSVSVNVALNDSDDFNNLDPSSVSLGLAVGGSCVFDAISPIVKFTPSVGFSGIASCIYQICDTEENCSDSLIEINVVDTNPPIPQIDFGTTSMGINSIPINVALNDSDLEGSVDQFSVIVSPMPSPIGGSCTLNPAAPFIVFNPEIR